MNFLWAVDWSEQGGGGQLWRSLEKVPGSIWELCGGMGMGRLLEAVARGSFRDFWELRGRLCGNLFGAWARGGTPGAFASISVGAHEALGNTWGCAGAPMVALGAHFAQGYTLSMKHRQAYSRRSVDKGGSTQTFFSVAFLLHFPASRISTGSCIQ